MTGQIIMGVVLCLPLLLGLIFRVSTSHIFFSLMAGELLGRYFGHDLEKLAGKVVHNVHLEGYGEIALMILPMILTAIFLKGSLSKGKTLLHIVPLAVTGVILAAFLLPLLPDNLQQGIRDFKPGDWLLHLNKLIIGGMVAIQLIALWLLNRGEHSSKGKHAG